MTQHSCVCFSFSPGLNSLPLWSKKKISGEDGEQGSMQEEMIARRKELLACISYCQFYSEENLVLHQKSVNIWQYHLLFWQNCLFLPSSFSRLSLSCWFPHLVRLIFCQGLLLNSPALWSSQHLYQSWHLPQDQEQEGGLDRVIPGRRRPLNVPTKGSHATDKKRLHWLSCWHGSCNYLKSPETEKNSFLPHSLECFLLLIHVE